MGKQVCVAIGVAKAGSLPILPGAVTGAHDFTDWAKKEKYDTHLVTDEKGPVTTGQLKALFKTIVADSSVERLIIYFAGHGTQPLANTAFWLLSHWETDSDEAVNVILSFSNAKRSGIGQIAVFSDACRNTVPGGSTTGGSSIFPKPPASYAKSPQWDQFFASRLDAEAQEVRATATAQAYGIFTKCVLRALAGSEEKAIKFRLGNPARAVTSQSLATFLEDAIPEESGRTPGAEVQFPEAISGWRDPKEIYAALPDLTVFDQTPSKPASVRGFDTAALGFGVNPSENSFENMARESLRSYRSGPPVRRPKPRGESEKVKKARERHEKAAREFEDLLAASKGRKSFETRQGLTVLGANVKNIVPNRNESADLFIEDGAPHVRGHGGMPQAVAIELDTGNWIGACILPQLVGTVVAVNGCAASVNYMPAVGGHFLEKDFEKDSPLVGKWTALMQQGRFATPDDLEKAAEELRMQKHVNPSLGILAAYAYERAGMIEGIDSMVDYFAGIDQPVPFDIAMLSTHPIVSKDGHFNIGTERYGSVRIAGAFPLMTQGWTFLTGDEPNLSEDLLGLRSGLVPALWTTFNADAGKKLAASLERGLP